MIQSARTAVSIVVHILTVVLMAHVLLCPLYYGRWRYGGTAGGSVRVAWRGRKPAHSEQGAQR